MKFGPVDRTSQRRLSKIVGWLQARNPDAAKRVGRQILNAIALLDEHPYIGSQGARLKRAS